MSAVSAAATQQKFTSLRKRLDQLGYRQPLGVESLPLVEKIFVDLVHTTESLKKTKLQLNKGKNDKVSIDAHIEPYKSDNAKLVKENNDLHHQIIKQREESEVLIRQLKSSLRKFEHENADLRFLNNQYVHKIRSLEKESKQKSDRILQLQEKNFHAVVQTPGGRKKSIPFRRQRMEVDCTLPPSDTPLSTPRSQADDPYVADLLKVADDNIAKYRDQTQDLVSQKESLEGKVSMLRKQVDTRDSEIDRMSRLLEGGRPYDVVALEARNQGNERLISHLNIQIDYLQQKNQELQKQVDDALYQARTANNQSLNLEGDNIDLKNSLQDVDFMAKRLQVDKDLAIKTADREIDEVKNQLLKSRAELENMDYEVAQLKTEKATIKSELKQLNNELVNDQEDQSQLRELLDRVQEDKRKLSRRITKLNNNERDLVLEIDRLKHRRSATKKAGKIGPKEQLIRGLEQERDYWKSEVDVLQSLMKTTPRSRVSSPARSPARSPSPGRKSRTRSPTKLNSRATSPMRTPTKERSKNNDSMIKALEEERDHYKRECSFLKTLKQRPASPTRTPTKSRLGNDDTELYEVRKERDELQSLLDKFERHMSEIQANVKVLTTERDNMSGLYEETKEELTRLRREVVRSPKSPKTSLAAQAVLRRVENERDDAISELRKLTTERDTLRERLKIATETQLAERARLEQKVEDLDEALRGRVSDQEDLEIQLNATQRQVDTLEIQVKNKAIELARTQEEANQNRVNATQMKLLADQAERSLEDHQVRLARKEADLRNNEEKVIQLEVQVNDLQRSYQNNLEDMSKLRSTVGALDQEKDHLQSHVDDKAERIVDMSNRIAMKERTIGELEAAVSDLQTSLGRSNDAQGGKDLEINSLRRQADGMSEELTEVGRGREVALRENRRIQDDLATMTRENQSINQDLQFAIDEKEHLKEQVQDYILKVNNAEEILRAKDQERSDLLEQYRTLSQEAERYETHNHQLESEGSNLRLELMTKEGEIRRLQEQLGGTERDNESHKHNQQEYEHHISSLTRSVAGLEEQLRATEDEKHGVLQDLSAVRDLCTRIEANRDALQRQLSSKTLEHEKVTSILDDMKQETMLLRDQINNERGSIRNLEDLLKNNRESEFHAQLTTQEKETEIQLMKDRLILNESKIESQSRELTTLRTRTIELESDLGRMRSNLTNERFEKERALQELRRQGVSMAGSEMRMSFPASDVRSSTLSSPLALSPSRSTTTSPLRHSQLHSDDRLDTSSGHTM